MPLDHRLIDRLNEIDTAISVAAEAGLTMPPALKEARRVSDELGEISIEQPLPAKPIDPTRDTIEQLDEQATLRARMHTRTLLADEARPAAIGELQRHVVTALPGWITVLQSRYADTITTLRELAASGVPNVAGNDLARLTTQQFDTWQRFARLAAEADDTLATRHVLGRLRGESLANALGNAPLMLAACILVPQHVEPRVRRDDAGMSVVGDLADLHRERYERLQVLATAQDGDAVTRWLHLLDAEHSQWLRLGLATLKDVPRRALVAGFWQAIPHGQAPARHAQAYTAMTQDSTGDRAATETTRSRKDKGRTAAA